MVVQWTGFTGTITRESGTIARMVLQEELWEDFPDCTWRALFHPTSPTSIFRNVNTFKNLEDAYDWCVKQINEHEEQTGGGSSSQHEIPQGGSRGDKGKGAKARGGTPAIDPEANRRKGATSQLTGAG